MGSSVGWMLSIVKIIKGMEFLISPGRERSSRRDFFAGTYSGWPTLDVYNTMVNRRNFFNHPRQCGFMSHCMPVTRFQLGSEMGNYSLSRSFFSSPIMKAYFCFTHATSLARRWNIYTQLARAWDTEAWKSVSCCAYCGNLKHIAWTLSSSLQYADRRIASTVFALQEYPW